MLEPERMIAHHAVARMAWLRAAALRANGGIVALAALLIGVAAAAGSEGEVLLAGLAGLVAGALAIAMAEYAALAARTDARIDSRIDTRPVLPAGTPADEDRPVAVHRRSGPADDLVAGMAGGLADYHGASPLQVAATSAATFALGAALPLAAGSAFRLSAMPLGVGLVALTGVAALSALGARSAGLATARYTARATGWAAAGLAGAFVAGRLLGTALI